MLGASLRKAGISKKGDLIKQDVPRQDSVSGHSINHASPILLKHPCSAHVGLDIVHDVVHHDSNLAVHVAH